MKQNEFLFFITEVCTRISIAGNYIYLTLAGNTGNSDNCSRCEGSGDI